MEKIMRAGIAVAMLLVEGLSWAQPTPPAVGGLPLNAQPQAVPKRIRLAGNVQAALLIKKVAPVYPTEAKQKHIEGKVLLQATIGKDGSVIDLKVLNGDPLLAKSALDA